MKSLSFSAWGLPIWLILIIISKFLISILMNTNQCFRQTSFILSNLSWHTTILASLYEKNWFYIIILFFFWICFLSSFDKTWVVKNPVTNFPVVFEVLCLDHDLFEKKHELLSDFLYLMMNIRNLLHNCKKIVS